MSEQESPIAPELNEQIIDGSETVTATITATLPALVREVVAAMAREPGPLDAVHSTSEKTAVLARLRQMRSELRASRRCQAKGDGRRGRSINF